MPERYTLSNRTDDKTKDNAPKEKGVKNSTPKLPSIPPIYWLILTIIVVVVTNIATYFIVTSIYNKRLSDADSKTKDLQTKLSQAEEKNNNLIGKNNKNPGSTDSSVSEETRKKIQALIDSKKYQDITALLGENTTVVVAGSSTSQQTRQQVLDSLGYLNSSTGSWNWNLTANQLQQLQQGNNAQYFGDNAIVGQSSDGYIVAIVINDSGQVSSVFMSPNAQDAGVSSTPDSE